MRPASIANLNYAHVKYGQYTGVTDLFEQRNGESIDVESAMTTAAEIKARTNNTMMRAIIGDVKKIIPIVR